MIFVCNYHVKQGLSILPAPHICKTTLESKCKFCDKCAQYEMELDYFFVHTRRKRKRPY